MLKTLLLQQRDLILAFRFKSVQHSSEQPMMMPPHFYFGPKL